MDAPRWVEPRPARSTRHRRWSAVLPPVCLRSLLFFAAPDPVLHSGLFGASWGLPLDLLLDRLFALLLVVLAVAPPAAAALVPSVLVAVVPIPVAAVYRIHRHRRALLAIGWTAAALLAVRNGVSSGGVDPAQGSAGILAGLATAGWPLLVVGGLSGFYLLLHPNRLFAPLVDPPLRPAGELVDAIDADEEVVGVEVAGEARAYTLTTLIRSHLVVDRSGGEEVAVTYCSLSATGVAFRAPERRLRTATALDNNVVLFDEASGDLVQQMAGRVVCGPGAGAGLATLPVTLTTWDRWRRLHPAGRVAHLPPRGLFDRLVRGAMLRLHRLIPRRPTPFHPLSYRPDPRLPAMERVLGVTWSGAARAYRWADLPVAGVRCEEVGGEPLVLLCERQSAGAPSPRLAAAFSRRCDGRVLDFEPLAAGRPAPRSGCSVLGTPGRGEAGLGTGEVAGAEHDAGNRAEAWFSAGVGPRAGSTAETEAGAGVGAEAGGGDRSMAVRVGTFVVARDLQTGTRWDLAGRAVEGPLAGRRLDPLPGHPGIFWFAWAALHPQTDIAPAAAGPLAALPASAVSPLAADDNPAPLDETVAAAAIDPAPAASRRASPPWGRSATRRP